MAYNPVVTWLLIFFVVLVITGLAFREYYKRKKESHYGYPPKP